MIGFVFRQLRHFRRYNEILGVLIKYGFDDYVSYMDDRQRFTFLKKLISAGRYKRARELNRWERMRKVCEELGPTFVKFGQIISNRPDLLPEELILELRKLQDSVGPFPAKQLTDIIKKETGKSVDELFQSFSMTPLASASIAQVHRAVLRDGTEVVVKVQRPNIRKVIEEDILIMRDFAEMLSKRIPSLANFDAVGLVESFAESIQKELDFVHEAWNLQRFSYYFQKDETIVVPKVHKKYSTDKVLTMDFIDGVKITDLTKIRERGLDEKLLGERVIRSFYQQVFEFGYFHADPHAGNLLAMANNKVGYIDFGMMGSIMRRDMENLGNLILAIKDGSVKRIIRYIHFLGDVAIVSDSRQLEFDVHEFVGKFSVSIDKYQDNLSEMLLELKDIIIKHNLKVPGHFFLLTRAMVSAEGIVRQLNPDLSLTSEVQPFIIKMIKKDHGISSFGKRLSNFAYEFGNYMEDFPNDLRQVMKMLKHGEIKVDLEHQGIDPVLDAVNRSTRLMIGTIILASLLVSSALIVVSHVPPYWKDIPVLGWIGFGVAIIVAIFLLSFSGRR